MLAIRMQRTGRSGHAQFRVIVQDSRAHPKSGRVVEYLGSYNPHTKQAQLDKDTISSYLKNGAQPSDRVAKLLKKEGLKLPSWVSISPDKKRKIRHPDKLRRNAPPEQKAAASKPASTEEHQAEEAPAEGAAEQPEPETAAQATPEPEEHSAEVSEPEPLKAESEAEPSTDEPAQESDKPSQ